MDINEVVHYVVVAVLIGIIVILFAGWFGLPPQPDPMVIKIMKGDLPPCEATLGTPTGYYCQVNNVSMFCKVDTTAADSYVRTHAYCKEMMWV